MLTAGLRVGEAAALLWRHVVWERQGVLVLQTIKRDGTIGPPKSGEERATLLPQRTLNLLRQWHAETPFPDPEHFIFFSDSGDRHLQGATISRKVPDVVNKVGPHDPALPARHPAGAAGAIRIGDQAAR